MIIIARSKPREIEALQYTGSNLDEVLNFVGSMYFAVSAKNKLSVYENSGSRWNEVQPGEYIIKGTDGVFYPCPKATFDTSYEIVNNAREETRENT
jgi:hypothetical protein